ncbi:hypothetical protein AYO40_00455 [Planctomycetaceae bacterium SCGC AG-212-D15]|nr:hypothetical protein AYO40_00455 [Planctomycetaceae bacterium SCGC AG-212-D15]
MAGDEQPTPANRKTGNSRAMVGCVWFVACFVLGLLATAVVRDYALRELPRTEVYEALYRDGLAVQWSCGGWLISFALSLLVAVVAARCTRR